VGLASGESILLSSPPSSFLFTAVIYFAAAIITIDVVFFANAGRIQTYFKKQEAYSRLKFLPKKERIFEISSLDSNLPLDKHDVKEIMGKPDIEQVGKRKSDFKKGDLLYWYRGSHGGYYVFDGFEISPNARISVCETWVPKQNYKSWEDFAREQNKIEVLLPD
jgi:hypothetical protein